MNTGQAFMHAPQVVHAQRASGETLQLPLPIKGEGAGASSPAEARLSNRPVSTFGPLATSTIAGSDEKRGALITEVKTAETARRACADRLQEAENAMAEADRDARAALEAASAAREDLARAEERFDGAALADWFDRTRARSKALFDLPSPDAFPPP